jgi:imidazolonepropionase-like amidohydrolase
MRRTCFQAHLLFGVYFFSFLTFAQTPPDTGTTAIHAGRLFDSENGTFLPDHTIIVKDKIIIGVGQNLAIPQGARIIDLRRFTVLPGLIDAHTHLLYLEDPSSNLTMEE